MRANISASGSLSQRELYTIQRYGLSSSWDAEQQLRRISSGHGGSYLGLCRVVSQSSATGREGRSPERRSQGSRRTEAQSRGHRGKAALELACMWDTRRKREGKRKVSGRVGEVRKEKNKNKLSFGWERDRRKKSQAGQKKPQRLRPRDGQGSGSTGDDHG